jgi:uncharacterized repeat protein (TIGR03806 family)
MRTRDLPLTFAVAAAVGVVGQLTLAFAADDPAIPAGIQREGWTGSRIVGTPDPPLPYTVEAVWPELQFENPVDWAVEPGTGRIFILQLNGKLFCFSPAEEHPRLELVYDVAAHVAEHNNSYGIAFHPDYERNREVFLSYVLPPQRPEGSRVSRFRMRLGERPRLDPDSEEIILTWPSGGHNGACLKFGPDGDLYVSTGDGSGPFPPDQDDVGQDLADVRSAILRIDVDHHDGQHRYRVPADNPFVDVPGARGEIWAYGFRNPWKMNFDPATGDLWCGDVGWELWELVFGVERGGNYGWSIMEGPQPVRSDLTRGPTPIQPPITVHPHTESRSVTGGYVYRGTRLDELRGAYIYGDYVTGKIWGLRTEGSQLVQDEELADTALAVITFGEDAAGELYVVDYAGGIYRLVPNPARSQPQEFPHMLSETGLFSSVAEHRPAPGVIPYVLQTQQWADGATAEQYLALPGTSSIELQRNREQWKFPVGTVFAKTISLDVDGSGSARRLETQVLHYDGEAWRPYTYVWNDAQTDAELAPAEGFERTFSIADPGSPAGTRQLTWRFHSRAECSTCHVPRAGDAIGFTVANLNRDQTLWGVHANQLDLFAAAAVFDRPVERGLRSLVMADVADETAPVETRARSYLAINCAHCHRRGGGGTAHIEFPFEHTDEQTLAIDEPPTQGTFGLPQARLIAPGDLYRSVLYYRLATVGRGHMPKLGARNVDDRGVALIADWIDGLPAPADPLPAGLADAQQHEAKLAQALSASSEGATEEVVEKLLSSTGGAMRLSAAVAAGELPGRIDEAAIEQGAAYADPVIRGLFERFLPEERRSQALGAVVDRAELLSLEGDVERGRDLFFNAEGVQCRNCHQVEGRGRIVGPDLSHVAKENAKPQILEAILDPSAKIDAKYVNYILVTTDGRVLTGVLLERTDDVVKLRDAQGNEHPVPREEIEELASQPKSLMPELLLQEMTAAEVADLLAFLSSLK